MKTLEQKRNFGDEVLFINLEKNPFDHSLRALFYKGVIKGITEMDSGQIFYFIKGHRFDIYTSEKLEQCNMEKIPSQFCFDNPTDLLMKVDQLFKPKP